MTNKNTGFDAFFDAVTSSKEFKNIVSKDWGKELEDNLKSVGQDIQKASNITNAFKEAFDTKQARKIGESYKSKQSTNNKAKTKEKKTNINIRYFKNTNPDIWGFKGVAGMKELKQNLSENFIKPLKFKFLIQKLDKDKNIGEKKDILYKKIHEAYKKFDVSIPTGMLFYGPPGTGKTFITKKLAQELGAGLIKKSVGEFGSSYIHQTSKNIKDFFTQAKKASEKGPIILFLDEIDSLISKRTQNIDANKAEEVSQFLQEFNALEEAPNLIVIAATNRPDHLDSAILRSGRFDKKIYIGPPDFDARKELFQIYIEKKKRPHAKLDYKKLATLTDNYVAADIETICDEVARDAGRFILDLVNTLDNQNANFKDIEDKLDDTLITMELLEKAIGETTSSLKYTDILIYENFLKKS